MDQHWNRRGFLRAGAAAGLLTLAGCSSDKAPPAATGGGGNGPVTITHAFGETTIPQPPKRVVSAGLTGQDDLLALGIVPVAVTNWFGDQPFGVWPWAQPKLGAAKPVVLNLDNGIQVKQISGLKPDLIVATDAGLDQDTYQKLAAIAPTLAQSDGGAFFEPWKDQAKAIGQAVYQSGQITSLINGVDKEFTAVADKYPQFKNKRVLLLQGRLHDDNVVATTGWQTDFLKQMGLGLPESLAALTVDQQPRIHPPRQDQVGPRRRRTADLDDRKRGGTGCPAGQSGRGAAAFAQRVHHQGPGRGNRLRVAAELPAGGRPVAAADRQHSALERAAGRGRLTELPSSNGQQPDRHRSRLRRSGPAAAIRQHRRGIGVDGCAA